MGIRDWHRPLGRLQRRHRQGKPAVQVTRLVLTILQRNGTDTAGHLGGIIAGIAYYRYLRMRPF